MHFKIRTKLIFAFFSLIFSFILIGGILAFYSEKIVHDSVHNIKSVAEERAVIANLIFDMERALMPGNDYILTGEKKYIDDFYKVSDDVEKSMKEAERIVSNEEARKVVGDVRITFQNMKEITQKIFEIQNPIGNREAVRLMEEMDYRWAYPFVERLKELWKIYMEEYRKVVNTAERARVQLWVIMIGGAVFLITFGIFFALFYSGLFVKPIKRLHNSADAIAGGNFKTRLDIKTGDEIEQLSNAMNEMAAQLDNSYATLEQRVEERTRELKESEERLSTITDTAGDAIIVMKAPDTIYMWNKKAEEMFGYPVGEAIGRELHKLIAPEICKEKAHKGMQEFFKTGMGAIVGKTVEIMAIRRDGAEFPVELSVSAMKIKGEWHAIGIVRDITERKRADEELQLIHFALNHAADSVFFMNPSGKFLYVNETACRVLGYSKEELLSMSVADINPNLPDGVPLEMSQATKKAGIGRVESEHRTKDGRLIPVEVVVAYFQYKGEDYHCSFVRDIIERKKADEKIRQRIDELEQFRKITIKRELKMAALKKRVEELEKMLGIKGA